MEQRILPHNVSQGSSVIKNMLAQPPLDINQAQASLEGQEGSENDASCENPSNIASTFNLVPNVHGLSQTRQSGSASMQLIPGQIFSVPPHTAGAKLVGHSPGNLVPVRSHSAGSQAVGQTSLPLVPPPSLTAGSQAVGHTSLHRRPPPILTARPKAVGHTSLHRRPPPALTAGPQAVGRTPLQRGPPPALTAGPQAVGHASVQLIPARSHVAGTQAVGFIIPPVQRGTTETAGHQRPTLSHIARNQIPVIPVLLRASSETASHIPVAAPVPALSHMAGTQSIGPGSVHLVRLPALKANNEKGGFVSITAQQASQASDLKFSSSSSGSGDQTSLARNPVVAGNEVCPSEPQTGFTMKNRCQANRVHGVDVASADTPGSRGKQAPEKWVRVSQSDTVCFAAVNSANQTALPVLPNPPGSAAPEQSVGEPVRTENNVYPSALAVANHCQDNSAEALDVAGTKATDCVSRPASTGHPSLNSLPVSIQNVYSLSDRQTDVNLKTAEDAVTSLPSKTGVAREPESKSLNINTSSQNLSSSSKNKPNHDLTPSSSDTQVTVVDVEEEDIEDCMLLSIDLSKQVIPIGKKIHNLQVIIDDEEEDNPVSTVNPKSVEKAIDTAKEPALPTKLTKNVDPCVDSTHGKSSSTETAGVQSEAEGTHKNLSLSEPEADADIEIYIDQDIKEERLPIDIEGAFTESAPAKDNALAGEYLPGRSEQSPLFAARASLTKLLNREVEILPPSVLMTPPDNKPRDAPASAEKTPAAVKSKKSKTVSVSKSKCKVGKQPAAGNQNRKLPAFSEEKSNQSIVPCKIKSPNPLTTFEDERGKSEDKNGKPIAMSDDKSENSLSDTDISNNILVPSTSKSYQSQHLPKATKASNDLNISNIKRSQPFSHASDNQDALLSNATPLPSLADTTSDTSSKIPLRSCSVETSGEVSSNTIDPSANNCKDSSSTSSDICFSFEKSCKDDYNNTGIKEQPSSTLTTGETLGKNPSNLNNCEPETQYESSGGISTEDSVTTVEYRYSQKPNTRCSKCKRVFASSTLLSEHLQCSPSCRARVGVNTSKPPHPCVNTAKPPHPTNFTGALGCAVCAGMFQNIDAKFQHVAQSRLCFGKYTKYCVCCNSSMTPVDEDDHMQQSLDCKERYLKMLAAEKASLDEVKAKQNTGLLLMSAGAATLSSVNPSTSCTVRCESCGAWFSSYARFRLHLRWTEACKEYYHQRYSIKPKSGTEEAEKPKVPASSNKPVIVCPVCGKKFATNAMLTIHVNEIASCRSAFLRTQVPKVAKRRQKDVGKSSNKSPPQPASQTLQTSGKSLKDNICKTDFESTGLKQAVIKLSPKSVMCKCCHGAFVDDRALSRHLQSASSCKTPLESVHFQCNGCKKYFVGDMGLAKHIQRSIYCQTYMDSLVSTRSKIPKPDPEPPVLTAAVPPPAKPSPKAQGGHTLQVVDIDRARYNEPLPQVIRPLESLDSERKPASVAVTPPRSDDIDDVSEIEAEFSSSDHGGQSSSSSSSTSSDEADVEFRCKACDKVFTEKVLFKKHMKQHRAGSSQADGAAPRKIKCEACRRKLKSQKSFQAHLLKSSFCFLKVTRRHWYKRPNDTISCNMCRKTLKSVKDLSKHCFKNMTCRLCFVDAVLKDMVSRSEASSSSDRSRAACSNESASVNEVSSSGQCIEPSKQDEKEQNDAACSPQAGDSPSLTYQCEHCRCVFTSRYQFQLHFFSSKPGCLDHYSTLGPQSQAQVPYCFRCKERFFNLHKLRVHKCIGFRRYVRTCSHCSFRFPSLAALESHAQNSELCIKALETQDQERQAAKATGAQKQQKGAPAKKATSSSPQKASKKETLKSEQLTTNASGTQSVTNLVARKSTGFQSKKFVEGSSTPRSTNVGNKYSCRICASQFSTFGLLLDHSYQHTEEKQYCCRRCGYMCYHYNRLVSHEGVHDRMDRECKDYTDRLDLHSVVVDDNDSSAATDFGTLEVKLEREERVSGRKPKHLLLEFKNRDRENTSSFSCGICGQSYESQRDLKKHLAISARCKVVTAKSSKESLGDTQVSKSQIPLKRKQEEPLLSEDDGRRKEKVPTIETKPSVRIVTKVAKSGERILLAAPVEQVPKEDHLYCFACRRFLKSKEDVQRHSIYKKHCLLSRRVFQKAVWTPGECYCKVCKLPLKHQQTLRKHMLRKHNGGTSVLLTAAGEDEHQETPRLPVKNGEQVSCRLCGELVWRKNKTAHFLHHLNSLRTEIRSKSKLPMWHSRRAGCKICGSVNKSRKILMQHLRRHTEADIFVRPDASAPGSATRSLPVNKNAVSGRCKLCQKRFISMAQYKLHFNQSHSKRYPKPPMLFYLKDSQDIPRVPVIKEKTATKTSVESEHSETSPKKMFLGRCKLCHSSVKSISELRQHLKASHHKSGYQLKFPTIYLNKKEKCNQTELLHIKDQQMCKACGQTFSRWDNFKVHILHQHKELLPKSKNSFFIRKGGASSGQEKRVVCRFCHCDFENRRGFEAHLGRMHQSEDPLLSTILSLRQVVESTDKGLRSKDISTERTGRDSKETTGKEVAPSNRVTEGSNGPESQPGFSLTAGRLLPCGLCSTKVKASTYGRHLVTSHNWQQDRLYACQYCKVEFPYVQHMRNHRKRCEEDCRCSLCGRQIDSVRGLRNHVMITHKWAWDQYVEKVVSGGGAGVAPTGSHSSPSVTALKPKGRSGGETETKTCDICGSCFSDASQYLEHLQTHVLSCKVDLGRRDEISSSHGVSLEVSAECNNEGQGKASPVAPKEEVDQSHDGGMSEEDLDTSVEYSNGLVVLEGISDKDDLESLPEENGDLHLPAKPSNIYDPETGQEYSTTELSSLIQGSVVDQSVLSSSLVGETPADCFVVESRSPPVDVVANTSVWLTGETEGDSSVNSVEFALPPECESEAPEVINVDTIISPVQPCLASTAGFESEAPGSPAIQAGPASCLESEGKYVETISVGDLGQALVFVSGEPSPDSDEDSEVPMSLASTSSRGEKRKTYEIDSSSTPSNTVKKSKIRTETSEIGHSRAENEVAIPESSISSDGKETPEAAAAPENKTATTCVSGLGDDRRENVQLLERDASSVCAVSSSDNSDKRCAKSSMASSTSNDISVSSIGNDRVHVKTEPVDADTQSTDRNLFAFFDDSVDLIDDNGDDLEFISYDAPSLASFMGPRSPPVAGRGGRSSESKNVCSASSTIATPTSSSVDSVSSSTSPPDKARNVFDLLNN